MINYQLVADIDPYCSNEKKKHAFREHHNFLRIEIPYMEVYCKISYVTLKKKEQDEKF